MRSGRSLTPSASSNSTGSKRSRDASPDVAVVAFVKRRKATYRAGATTGQSTYHATRKPPATDSQFLTPDGTSAHPRSRPVKGQRREFIGDDTESIDDIVPKADKGKGRAEKERGESHKAAKGKGRTK
jgi:hypothetical protein